MTLSTRPRPWLPPKSAFTGFRFPAEVIVIAVRWYLPYSLSYRDVVVGATRERTTTALDEIARHQLIELRRGKILIRNPARLAAAAAHSDTTGPA